MKWKYFSPERETSHRARKWRWWDRGEDPPDGKWWINGETPDQLRVSFSGDQKGELGTTGLGLTHSTGLAGIGLWLEFGISMSFDQVEALELLLQKARSWALEPDKKALALQDFYGAAKGSAGGCIALAHFPGTEHVSAVLWSRGEEYELFYELSYEAIEALHEMTQYAVDWKNKGGAPRAGGVNESPNR